MAGGSKTNKEREEAKPKWLREAKKKYKYTKKTGRPVVWTTEELEIIGKKLIEWCREERNNHMSGFEDENDLPVDFCEDMARRRKSEFRRYYKQAQRILGHKIMNKAMFDGGDRWITSIFTPMYLDDVDDYIESKKDKESERRIKETDKKMEAQEKYRGKAESSANTKAENLIEALREAVGEDEVD